MKRFKKLSKRAFAFICMLSMIVGCVLTYTGPLGEAESASVINDEWNMFSSEEGVNIVDANGKAYKQYGEANVNLPESARDLKYLELHIKLWLKDADAVNVMKKTTVELANNTMDQMERYWNLSNQTLVPGMNEVVLKLNNSSAYNGSEGKAFDMAQTIKFFRIFTNTTDYATVTNGILLYDVTIKNDNVAGLNFGLNDSHLQLSNTLSDAPEAIEASIKVNKAQYEWVLRSSQDTSWSYGLGTNATYHTITDGETGPDAGTSYATTTMSAGGNFGFTKSFNISIPEYYTVNDIALDFWFKTDNKEATMGYIDLTSAGTYSDERRYFNMNTYLKDVVEDEWYHVVVPVSKGVQDSANPNKFNLQEVDYLRWHSTKITGESVHYSITDIKLVVLAQEGTETNTATKWPLFAASESSAGTQLSKASSNYNANNQTTTGVVGEGENGPKAGTPYTQIDVAEGQAFGFQHSYQGITSVPATGNYEAKDLVVKFWLWCEKENVLPTTYFSLSTYGWRYNNAVRWTLSEHVSLNEGWNYVELRLDSGTTYSGFDHKNILYAGLYSTEPLNQTSGKYEPLPVSEACSFKITDVTLEVRPNYNQEYNTLLQAGSTLDAAAKYAATESEYKGNQVISNGYVSGDEANDFTPAEGTAYTQFDVKAGDYFCIRTSYAGLKETYSITQRYDRSELAISFWLYNESEVTLPQWSSVHLSSGGWLSASEEYLYLQPTSSGDGPAINLTQGWNYIEIPLGHADWVSRPGDSGVEFDYTKINFFQFYWKDTLTVANTFKVTDIRLVPLKETQETKTLANIRSAKEVASGENGGWWYTMGTKTFLQTTTLTENGPEVGTNFVRLALTSDAARYSFNNKFTYRVPTKYNIEDIALDVWIYASEETKLSGGSQLMLHSVTSGTDSNMLYWKDLVGKTYKKGWNHLYLKLSDATQKGTFDLQEMCYMRWHGSAVSNVPVTLGFSDFKLVLVNEPHKVITTEITDTTTLQYNNMIFSNVNATGETSPYALYLDKEGQPTLLWGTTAFTLDYDVRTGKWVDIKAVRNEDKTVSFYIDGELMATSSTRDARADDELSFTTAHRIAADGAGLQMMKGSIANLRIYSDAEATSCTGNWPLTGDIQYILTPMEDTSGNNNTAVYRGTRAEDWIDYDKTQYDFLYNEEGEEDYWSMVFIPDIQNITQKYYGYDQIWYQTAQWIADNVETENIKHVIGAGDNSWSNIDVEYEVAKAGFDKFTNLVSWSNMSGNHEYDWGDDDNRTSTKLTKYFNLDYINNTKAAETYMGSFDDPQGMSTTENSYYRFNVNGVNWMILQLEYHPRLSVINWAKEITTKYLADNIILTTHSYINGTGEYCGHSKAYLSVGDGDQYLGNSMSKAWDELKTCSNIKLILCGHSANGRGSIATKMETNALGQTVPALMINAQDKDLSEPGNNTAYYSDKCLGMVSILRFSADGSQAALQWYSPQWGKSFNPVSPEGERNSCNIQLAVNKEAYVEEHQNVTAGVAPATIPDGYVFAGWFTDNTCTKAITRGSTVEKAYAKFVDKDILTVKAQIRLDVNGALPAESEGTDMRFVTTVDTGNYQKVGFHIVCTAKGIDKTIETTKVYKSLYQVGKNAGEKDTILPTVLSPISEYFTTYTLFGVNEYDTVITMTPYWVTLDGTTVYGETADKYVNLFNEQ